jgi:ribosomal protein S18 acetylase RimI-like enzyme
MAARTDKARRDRGDAVVEVPSPRPRRGRRPVEADESAWVRVRRAQPADAFAVAALRRQVEEIHARLLPDYFQVACEPRLSGGDGVWSLTFVAEVGVGGPVRGYLLARIVDTPADPVMIPCRRLQIVELGVDVSMRRAGVGRRLMELACEWGGGLGAREVVLTVWSDNQAAQHLYEHLGFEPIARVMRRDLGVTQAPRRRQPRRAARGTAKRPTAT